LILLPYTCGASLTTCSHKPSQLASIIWVKVQFIGSVQMYKEDCSSLFLETYHNHVRSKMLVIPFPNVAKSIVITIIKGIIGLLFKLRGTAIGTFAISYPWIWWGMLHSYAVVDTRVPLYATLCPSWSIWVCIREFSANTLSTLVKYETYSEKVLLYPFISFSTRLELHLMLSDLLVFGRSRGTRLRLLY